MYLSVSALLVAFQMQSKYLASLTLCVVCTSNLNSIDKGLDGIKRIATISREENDVHCRIDGELKPKERCRSLLVMCAGERYMCFFVDFKVALAYTYVTHV